MRVAVADVEVTEHLIVGPVLLDDEKDMLHPGADLSQGRIGRGPSAGAGQSDVAGDLKCGRNQPARAGQREIQKSRFLHLEDVLIGCAASVRLAAVDGKRGGTASWIGSRRALAVGNEDPAGTRGDCAWVPSGRNQCLNSASIDQRKSIDPAEGYKKAPVGELGERVGVEPLAKWRSSECRGQAEARFADQLG